MSSMLNMLLIMTAFVYASIFILRSCSSNPLGFELQLHTTGSPSTGGSQHHVIPTRESRNTSMGLCYSPIRSHRDKRHLKRCSARAAGLTHHQQPHTNSRTCLAGIWDLRAQGRAFSCPGYPYDPTEPSHACLMGAEVRSVPLPSPPFTNFSPLLMGSSILGGALSLSDPPHNPSLAGQHARLSAGVLGTAYTIPPAPTAQPQHHNTSISLTFPITP